MAADVSVGRQDLCSKLSRVCLFRATYMMWAGYLLLHLGNQWCKLFFSISIDLSRLVRV